MEHIRIARMLHLIARMLDTTRCMRPPPEAIAHIYKAEAELYAAMEAMNYDHRKHSHM